jgi:hypothetical protein
MTALPPLDAHQRYSIEEACAYLRKGRSALYQDIRDERIKTIKDGARTYVPGAEIVRLSSLA